MPTFAELDEPDAAELELTAARASFERIGAENATTLAAAAEAYRVLDERQLELKGLAEPVTVATVDW